MEEKMKVLDDLSKICHEANKKWWVDLKQVCPRCEGHGALGADAGYMPCPNCGGTGHPFKDRNVGELIALCHAELSEALEGHRKSLMDDKLPQFPMITVELADLLIRVFDMCGGLKLDLAAAFIAKMEYNRTRADHKLENRKAPGGKAY